LDKVFGKDTGGYSDRFASCHESQDQGGYFDQYASQYKLGTMDTVREEDDNTTYPPVREDDDQEDMFVLEDM
jgi:hypothetical protein